MFTILFLSLSAAIALAAPASVARGHAKISCHDQPYYTNSIRYYEPNDTSYPLDYHGRKAIIYTDPSVTGETWEFQQCNSTYIMGDEGPVPSIIQGHIISKSTSLCLTAHEPFQNSSVTLAPCLDADDAKQLTQWWAYVAPGYEVSQVLLIGQPWSSFSGVIGGSYGPSAPPTSHPASHFPLKLGTGGNGYCLDFVSNSSGHCGTS